MLKQNKHVNVVENAQRFYDKTLFMYDANLASKVSIRKATLAPTAATVAKTVSALPAESKRLTDEEVLYKIQIA